MTIVNVKDEWSMELDYTQWSANDIANWLESLHSDFEQYGQRAQFLKIDGEQFETLGDATFLRNYLGIKIESHCIGIVRAVKRRMVEYNQRSRIKNNKNVDKYASLGNETDEKQSILLNDSTNTAGMLFAGGGGSSDEIQNRYQPKPNLVNNQNVGVSAHDKK